MSLLPANEYIRGILEGNRMILSKAITLVESSRPEHQQVAQEIVSEILKKSQQSSVGSQVSSSIQHPVSSIQHPASSIQSPASSFRLGITGVPGVGKSTFIEALGKYLTGKGHKLAVLAIDPSSPVSGGSILGDKTRMEELSVDPNAFIRPSPAGGSLGGVARRTRETIYLCEAAGFDIIFVETVGVGQSETTVKSMVDFFLLLMLAGAGDELQGIKRGIIEMADAIIINKADGDNRDKAKIAAREYAKALHLFPPSYTGWMPVVDICSGKTKYRIGEVWEIVESFMTTMTQHGHFQKNRMEQNRSAFHEAVESALREKFFTTARISQLLDKMEEEILLGVISPYDAARKLLENYPE
jgi:LAO/AO transport system kinase